MKVLPTNGADKKLFLISLVISFLTTVNHLIEGDITKFIVNLLVNAIIIMIVIRIVVWIGKKAGIAK